MKVLENAHVVFSSFSHTLWVFLLTGRSWTPAPIHPDIELAADAARHMDTVSLLVQIYGSDDLFIQVCVMCTGVVILKYFMTMCVCVTPSSVRSISFMFHPSFSLPGIPHHVGFAFTRHH